MFVRIFVAFDNVNIKHSVHRHIKCAIQHLLKTNKLFVPVIYGFLQWRQMKRVCDQKRIKRRERRKRAVRQSTAADGFTAVIIEPLDKWTFLLVPKGVCASQQWNFASVICAQASSVQLRESQKDLEYKLDHRLSKLDRFKANFLFLVFISHYLDCQK